MTPTKKLAPSSDSPLKLQFTDEIPQMTLRKALMGGTDPLTKYMNDLLPSVQKRLLTYLAHPPAGSLTPRSSLALNRHQPLAIQMKQDSALTTFREEFSFANAKIALGRVGLYEAAGSLSWLDSLMPYWGSQKLKGAEVTWTNPICFAADKNSRT